MTTKINLEGYDIDVSDVEGTEIDEIADGEAPLAVFTTCSGKHEILIRSPLPQGVSRAGRLIHEIIEAINYFHHLNIPHVVIMRWTRVIENFINDNPSFVINEIVKKEGI